MDKKKILGKIFLIWCISSLALLVYFSQTNNEYFLIILAQYFFVFGVILLIKLKNVFPLLFVLIGIAIPIFKYVNLKAFFDKLGINTGLLIGIILFVVILALGILIIYILIKKANYLKDTCTEAVDATIIGEDIRNDKGKLYSPIYEYWYNEQKYSTQDYIYKSQKNYNIGDIKKIFINPNDPTQIFIKRREFPLVFGIFLILFALFILFSMFA